MCLDTMLIPVLGINIVALYVRKTSARFMTGLIKVQSVSEPRELRSAVFGFGVKSAL
jgi:hypothetical protein